MKPLPADWLETTLTRPMPVLAPARGWAAMGTWFESPTPHGPLRLYLGELTGAGALGALALQLAWIAVVLAVGRVILSRLLRATG